MIYRLRQKFWAEMQIRVLREDAQHFLVKGETIRLDYLKYFFYLFFTFGHTKIHSGHYRMISKFLLKQIKVTKPNYEKIWKN